MIACAPASLEGGFAATGEGWTFAGALNLMDALGVFEASRALALPASGIVDLSGLQQADSSALAVMLALKRRAVAEGAKLGFVAIPSGIQALAHVYGVEELLAG
ncbi:MAG: STAS domain-containing protein [Betaproteobacteria bacterium]